MEGAVRAEAQEQEDPVHRRLRLPGGLRRDGQGRGPEAAHQGRRHRHCQHRRVDCLASGLHWNYIVNVSLSP